jgi:hypothetical protein
MIRALMILIPIVGYGWASYYLGRWQGRRDAAAGSDVTKIRLSEHARLLSMAREHHLAGELGVAMMLESSAERLLDGEDPKELT